MITPSIVVYVLLVNIVSSTNSPTPIVFDNLYSKENCESMAKIVKAHYDSNRWDVNTKCVMVRKAVAH